MANVAQQERSRSESRSRQGTVRAPGARRFEPKPGELIGKVFPELDPFVFEYYPGLQALYRMVEAEFDRPISRERAARCVHVSAASFSRFFRTRTGVRFREWLEAYRIERALEILAKEDVSTTLLARRVGYRQPATFLRAFKRVIGTTPQAWLRHIREIYASQ